MNIAQLVCFFNGHPIRKDSLRSKISSGNTITVTTGNKSFYGVVNSVEEHQFSICWQDQRRRYDADHGYNIDNIPYQTVREVKYCN